VIDFSPIRAVTFDCYGTLIDWETGLLETLRPLLERKGLTVDDETLLERYAVCEAAEEAGTYRPYRMVLRGVMKRLGAAYGFNAGASEERALEEALPRWRPFDDTVPALRALGSRYRLAIISNVDDDLVASTQHHLAVPFDAVITAQSVGSYKPSKENFLRALRTLALPPENILHVAQSLYHDVAPASACGLATVWVNRRHGRPGSGATPPSAARPDLEVPDLRTLASLAG